VRCGGHDGRTARQVLALAPDASAAKPNVVAAAERLSGSRPDLDDFLSAEATDRLAALYLSASSGPVIQRQTWSTELRSEMARAVTGVAERISGVRAHWFHELSGDTGAVRVDAAAVLGHTTFSEGDYDLVLVSDNAEDGLRLSWDHVRDQFELVLWGSFRH
jgi:hypothetical protein